MTEETAAEQLNQNTLYVTYCDGIGCNASTKGALKLAQPGYRVKELIGGIDWWKRDQYPVVENNQCVIETADAQLIFFQYKFLDLGYRPRNVTITPRHSFLSKINSH